MSTATSQRTERPRGRIRRALAVAAVVAGAVAGTAPGADATTRTPSSSTRLGTAETIDLDAFAQGIVERLDGHVVGFAYGIARNGSVVRSGAKGFRRLPQDGGWALAFDQHTMTQAASTAKTVSAAALLKALHAAGISPDAPVEPYLPGCWERPHPFTAQGISTLSFRDLLGHHSRLLPAPGSSCSADPLQCLRDVIAQGRIGTDTSDYQNINYALVRVILPFVLAPAEMHAAFDDASCADVNGSLNALVSDRFRDYLFDEVLAPVGVTASFYPSGDGIANYALMYDNSDWERPGVGPRADFHLRAGAGYLAIGAHAYARFLSALDAGLILPHQLVSQMKGVPGDRMGFDTSITGTLGEYVWKNGGCPGPGVGCSTLAVVFPNGMQAFVAINSGSNTYKPVHGGLDVIVRDAFDEALL